MKGRYVSCVAVLKGGEKGREQGGENGGGGTGERKGKETPAARTPHSACKL